MRAFLREFVITLILAGVFILIIQSLIVIPPSEVVTGSMKPTLQIGQRLIISKVAYVFHEPERGDIIVFHPTTNPQNGDFIKRIIGLPGESVEIRKGTVYIHEEDGDVVPLDEPYIKEAAHRPFTGKVIPEDEYFVMGDNRNNSSDSRTGWTVPHQNIVGKAWLSIWPPSEWGLAPNHSFEEELTSTKLLFQLP